MYWYDEDVVPLFPRLVHPAPGEVWLLVTSAFHMPRAVGIFRAQDWPVVAYPVDYQTGATVWKHKFRTPGTRGGAPGLLTTAGKLLFGGDLSGNFIAFDPANGKPLWHTRIGEVTNAPETYMVDGRQQILVAAGDTLYSFALYQ